MQIVIRKGRGWYKDRVGQVLEVEDDTVTISGVERYRRRDKDRVRWVRVEDAAPIRSGLVTFIDYHRTLIESDEKLPKPVKLHPLIDRMIEDRKALLSVIEVMAPLFETRVHEALENLRREENEQRDQEARIQEGSKGGGNP